MSKFKQQMEITGLKGLAAIIVMICHYMIIFFRHHIMLNINYRILGTLK